MDQEIQDIIKAIKSDKWDKLDKFLANGRDINASLSSTGPESGYTLLHFAVLKGVRKKEHLEKLIKIYGANVNSVGADGTTPLQISGLRDDFHISKVLLEQGADANAKLTREVLKKYPYTFMRNWKWPKQFEELSLCSLLSVKPSLESLEFLMCALKYGASIELKDKNNKTLLMYGAENGWEKYLCLFSNDTKCRPEFINARDNNGLHAVHYFLPNAKLGVIHNKRSIHGGSCCVWLLKKAGADINAMVNNNPDTLLINIAAEQCNHDFLKCLMEFRNPFPIGGKPLKYLLSVDPKKLRKRKFDGETVRKKRNESVKIIMEIYTLRREFGLFVPEEEMKLMDQLIAKKEIKKIVDDFKINFIDKLKKPFNDGSLTIYDLATKVFKKRSLNLLVKDEKLVDDYENYFLHNNMEYKDTFRFFSEIYFKISEGYKRRKIMEKVEEISSLRKFVPLPYEVVLMILEYLNNEELKIFVNSFYEISICE